MANYKVPRSFVLVDDLPRVAERLNYRVICGPTGSGKATTLYAQCEITKQGKRVAHVLIEAWQEDRRKPVAVARAHFLLSTPS